MRSRGALGQNAILRVALKRAMFCVAVAAPVTVGICAYGCNTSTEPPIEDFCGWLKDPENCFRDFGNDVQQFEGSAANSVPRCTNLSLNPAPSGAAQLGQFQKRTPLDKCFVAGGGQVVFDPPIDLTLLTSTSTISFKMLNADESECMTASWTDFDRFQVNFDPDKIPDGGTTEDLLTGGTFIYQRKAGRKTVAVACPNGESHYFDTLQVQKCPEYTNVQPRAFVEIVTGGLDATGEVPAMPDPTAKNGAITFSMQYQPESGDLANATNTTVTYFKCIIPPPPERCVNGVQDGEETDIDCGGTPLAGNPTCDRCQDGNKCILDSDCDSGKCDSVSGVLKCVKNDATTSTTTGTSMTTSTGTSMSTGSSSSTGMPACSTNSAACTACMNGTNSGNWLTDPACGTGYPMFCLADATCAAAFNTFKTCMCDAQNAGDLNAEAMCKSTFAMTNANANSYESCIVNHCSGATNGCNF